MSKLKLPHKDSEIDKCFGSVCSSMRAGNTCSVEREPREGTEEISPEDGDPGCSLMGGANSSVDREGTTKSQDKHQRRNKSNKRNR